MFTKSKKNGLKIIIVGGGKVGQTLIEQLSREGHDITLIDNNSDKLQEIVNLYDVMALAGNGASYSVQMEAGIQNADLIIAVTGSDELNLLCCTVAKQVGHCAAIARVRTPDYAKEEQYLQDALGLAMIINPELEAAKETSHILCLPTALEVNPFAHGSAELVKFKIPEGNVLHALSIAEFGKKFHRQVLICAIERNGEVYIPSGDTKMYAGDIISFVAPHDEPKAFMEAIGIKTTKIKETMIVGGGRVAFYLAESLLKMGIGVKIIERDRNRCEELSVLLPQATIINGDGSDEDLLIEEGIEYADAFVPLTGIDEENVMLTLYAQQISKAKVITKINRMAFRGVISKLDLGSVVYPRFITAEAIIAYVRARAASMDRNIETLYHMFDSRVEAIEFNITKESPITGTPLMQMALKKNLLVSCINRNGKTLIPSGRDCILPGDTVMVVTTHSGFSDISDILDQR